jgi:hypothetical protein
MENVEHKELRDDRLWLDQENIPPDVLNEGRLGRWARRQYDNAMLIAAAGAYHGPGSFDLVASVLWFAGFAVQPGYFTEEEMYDLDGDNEEQLRLWVERERERIRSTVETVGLALAVKGRLLDPLPTQEPPSGASEEEEE